MSGTRSPFFDLFLAIQQSEGHHSLQLIKGTIDDYILVASSKQTGLIDEASILENDGLVDVASISVPGVVCQHSAQPSREPHSPLQAIGRPAAFLQASLSTRASILSAAHAHIPQGGSTAVSAFEPAVLQTSARWISFENTMLISSRMLHRYLLSSLLCVQ